ncbi:DUF4870 domain-containing protein [Microbulbifer sp. SAOS-129_SWC]|uniref:DUF4870 domain-containing protein n=1 Tax=Microbulbifer sp. SAOS-129_SWC TaxID=3145235 RepID=UPI003217CC43
MEEYEPWGLRTDTFLMLMHLSQLSSYIMPGAGFLLPVIMWATNKDQSAEVDRHGKMIMNWMLSLLIYSVICFALIFVIVGAFLLWGLLLLNLIFVIIAAVNANDGKLWRYPLSISFFKVEEPRP